MTKRTLLSSTGAAILGIALLTACGGDDSSSTPSSAAPTAVSAACATPGAELVPLSTVEGEPTVLVPTPDGWDQTEVPAEAAQQGTSQIRLALVARGLAADGFAPNIVVTSTPEGPDTQAVLDAEAASITSGVPGVEIKRGSLCGYQSISAELTLPADSETPARTGTTMMVVVPNGTGSVSYSFTAQTTNAADPAYQQAVQTILDGIQITK